MLSVGQSFHEWKPLPEVAPVKATVMQKRANVMARFPKKKPYYIQKTYTGDTYQFQKRLEPVNDQPLEYTAIPLQWDELQYIPTGLIFKDQSRGNIKYLDKAHGLFSNEVNVIEEDSLGRIFLGTREGLGVFNGEEMKIYRRVEGFSFANIKDLKFDEKGRLWIITTDAFGYISGDNLYLPNAPTDLQLFSISFTSDGQVVLNTINNGMVFIEEDRYKIINQFASPFVCDYWEDKNGWQWVAVERFGISFIRNDSIFNIPRVDHINTARVFFENDSALWIGTFAGKIHAFENDSLYSIELSEEFNEYNTFSIESANGKIWIGAYGPGVFSIDSHGKVDHYSTREGLTGNFSYDIHKDRYDNVWIADLQDGISRIDENVFYQSDLSISDLSFAEILQDSLNNRWFLPAGTYLTRETEDEFIQYANETGDIFRLTTYAEHGLIREDEVWMSNYGMGITVFSESGYTFYLNGDEFFTNSVFYLEEDATDGVWMTTLNNQLVYYRNGEFYNYATVDPFKDFKFNKITKTNGGAIIAYTDGNGIIIIWDNNYWHLDAINGLSTNTVELAFQDKGGRIWLFQDGVIDMVGKGNEVLHFTSPVLRNNPINDIVEFENGEFLALSYNGLLMMKPNQQDIEMKLLDAAYGINVPDNNHLFIGNNDLLISGHGKLFRFDSSMFRASSFTPKLSIDRVMIGNQQNPKHDGFKVAQAKPIEVHFNVISWGRPATLHYQFMRNGQADSWEQQKSGIIDLNELDRGNYKLSAYLDDGLTKSDIQTIEFIVLPYWYETWWAFAAYTGLLILGGLAIMYYRGVRARQQREILQKLVEKKTQELQDEKQQVTKQLKEKEVLLKEVNHRVKNNLQIISSLLQMQVGKLENEELSHILLETHGRVRSMSLIHQKLYESNDISSIALHEYADQLMAFIKASFGESKAKAKVEIQSDDIWLDIEKAIPLGLILNELATNALKYGLNEKGEGTIRLTFELRNEDRVVFFISDGGPGVPDDFNVKEAKSLGLRLVTILTRQIDGELKLENHKGACFMISFPLHG